MDFKTEVILSIIGTPVILLLLALILMPIAGLIRKYKLQRG